MAFFRRRVVAKLVGCCAAVASPKGGLAPTTQAARHSGCTEPPGWPGAPSLPVPLLVAPGSVVLLVGTQCDRAAMHPRKR